VRRGAWALWALLLAAPTPARAVKPGTEYALDPKQTGLIFSEVDFPSARDSVTLHGWWFQGPPDAPVIVLCPHGDGTMADLLPAVKEFSRRGFEVLTFDLRDFGPGGPGAADSLRNLVFASRWVNDTEGALRYARSRAPRRFVFAWGQDLGGPLAVAAATRAPFSVDAVAVEGLFRSSQEQIAWLGTSQDDEVVRLHRLAVDPLDEPLSSVSRLTRPLLVVLAGKDDVTPRETTLSVCVRSRSIIERWELPAAGHAGAEQTPGYFDHIGDWFTRIARRLGTPQHR